MYMYIYMCVYKRTKFGYFGQSRQLKRFNDLYDLQLLFFFELEIFTTLSLNLCLLLFRRLIN